MGDVPSQETGGAVGAQPDIAAALVVCDAGCAQMRQRAQQVISICFWTAARMSTGPSLFEAHHGVKPPTEALRHGRVRFNWRWPVRGLQTSHTANVKRSVACVADDREFIKDLSEFNGAESDLPLQRLEKSVLGGEDSEIVSLD